MPSAASPFVPYMHVQKRHDNLLQCTLHVLTLGLEPPGIQYHNIGRVHLWYNSTYGCC